MKNKIIFSLLGCILLLQCKDRPTESKSLSFYKEISVKEYEALYGIDSNDTIDSLVTTLPSIKVHDVVTSTVTVRSIAQSILAAHFGESFEHPQISFHITLINDTIWKVVSYNTRPKVVLDMRRDNAQVLRVIADSKEVSFPQGIINSPKVAAEVGLSILNGIYGEDTMREELPLWVVRYPKDWAIMGNMKGDEYYGGCAHLDLNGSDGKVLGYWHEK